MSTRRRILAALGLVVALVAPALVFSQTNPLPGQIGDVTFNNVTIQSNLTVGGAINIPIFAPNNYGVDAGSTDTYVANLTPTPTAYVTGALYVLKAATANTGAASIAFNGLAAKTIVKAVSTTLANSDIVAGMLCLMVYDGTNMVLLNPRVL